MFSDSNTIRDSVISDNNFSGVFLISTVGSTADNNLVEDNTIGLNAAGTAARGNGLHGVVIQGGDDNLVTRNRISANAQAGVAVVSFFNVVFDPAVDSSILGNSIFDNGALGIDLENDGLTPNDPAAPDDDDTESNREQNFPVITSASIDNSTTVSGTLESDANQSYTIDFFTNPACDNSHGEGKTFLGSLVTATDGSGDANFGGTLEITAGTGDVVTATATNNTTGDTSEFSECFPVTGGGAGDTCNGQPVTITGTTNGPDNPPGTGGDDVVNLKGGNDTFDGGGGNDTICGGDDDDTLMGGNGSDDIFGEGGRDDIDGNKGNDEVDGGPGNDDQVQGGKNSDTVAGGTGGSDDCAGGGGTDSFQGGSAGAAGCETSRGIP